MSSVSPAPTVVGIEKEFAIADHLNTDSAFKRACFFGESNFSFISNTYDRALLAGGRLYKDMQKLEVAQHEEDSAFHATVAYEANRRLLIENFGLMRQTELSPEKRIFIRENCNDEYSQSSWGEHESYLVARSQYKRLLESKTLMLALVLRNLFCGAGRLLLADKISYALSERAGMLKAAYSHESVHTKPIVDTRDEALASCAKYARLHVTCGDGNTLVMSRFLKLLFTAHVVRGFQEGLFDRFEREISYDCAQGISDMQAVGCAFGDWRLPTLNNERAVMVLGQIYGLLRERYYAGASAIDQYGFDRMHVILDTLSRVDRPLSIEREEDVALLYPIVYDCDFALKAVLLNAEISSGERSIDKLLSSALEYHTLNPQDSILDEETRLRGLAPFINDVLVNKAQYEPLGGVSRAHMRSIMTRIGYAANATSDAFEVSWEYLNCHLQRERFEIDDPLADYLSPFQKVGREFLNRAYSSVGRPDLREVTFMKGAEYRTPPW